MALGGADNLARSPELRTKLLWTLGLLCAYRIGVHIPVPGVDGAALAHFFESVAGTLFGLFDMFSGGGLRNVSVFALGIMPYISASIILQLLQVVSPELKRMAKEEGAAGRRKITQYTRYATVLITVIQGFGIAVGLETMYSPGGAAVVIEPGWTFRLMTMLTLTAGTVLIMWLGEQITEKGIGNGISLIIFSGIVGFARTRGGYSPSRAERSEPARQEGPSDIPLLGWSVPSPCGCADIQAWTISGEGCGGGPPPFSKTRQRSRRTGWDFL